jgi:hypothetical protein
LPTAPGCCITESKAQQRAASNLTAETVAEQQQPPIRTLVPELQIGGPDETRDDYTFSAISGLSLDKAGRILATDLTDNVVRVYDANGKFAFQFGRAGDGPGEFRAAMSGVWSPDGLFWVNDEGNRRWVAFDVENARALPKATVRYESRFPNGRFHPTGFDASGNLLSPAAFRPAPGQERPTRVTLDRTGKLLRADTIPYPPADSLGDFTVTASSGSGSEKVTRTLYYYQPYGPTFEIAYSPTGEYARAVTGRYDVEWRDAGGRVLRRLRRDVVGPPLSARERGVGQGRIDDFVKRANISASQIPRGLPDRKAPIYGLTFDQEGRLWVTRRMPDGTPLESDLYDRAGKWIAIVRWPKDVAATTLIAARGDQVLGVARDSLDTQWVVRLRMK